MAAPLQPHPVYAGVTNVYADNVEAALKELSELDYEPVIGVEAFFPGLVLRPTIPVDSFLEHHYATLRSNVDCTNLIQLDLTIRRRDGSSGSQNSGVRGEYRTYRFHFQYNLHNELYSVDAMRKLVEAGSFQNPTMSTKRTCVDGKKFVELLMGTDLILNDSLLWIPVFGTILPFDQKIENLTDYATRSKRDVSPAQIFRGLYDLAHLVQLLRGRTGLPEKVADFFKDLDTYFPRRHITCFHDYTSLFFSRSNSEAVSTLEAYRKEKDAADRSGEPFRVCDGKPPSMLPDATKRK